MRYTVITRFPPPLSLCAFACLGLANDDPSVSFSSFSSAVSLKNKKFTESEKTEDADFSYLPVRGSFKVSVFVCERERERR